MGASLVRQMINRVSLKETKEWAESREQASIKSTERFPSFDVIFLHCYLGMPLGMRRSSCSTHSFVFQALFLFGKNMTLYHRYCQASWYFVIFMGTVNVMHATYSVVQSRSL